MTSQHALPKYVQAAEMLIREIAAGRLADGDRLPPEREMAAQMNLSVGTLRKALADLQVKGLLERVQGSGNYVKYSSEVSGVYRFFRLESERGGGLPTAEILSIARLPKPVGAPHFGGSRDAHRIRRLRRIDGTAAAIEEIWLDGARIDQIRESDLSESLYLFYRRALGLWISAAEDKVGIETVPDWAPAAFAPTPGSLAGHVERVAKDQDGAKAEYSRTWFDPERVRYVARLR